LTNTSTTFALVVENGAGANLTWSGSGNVWDVDSTADWNNGIGASVFHNGDYVTFNDVGDGSSTVNINSSVGPAAVTNNSEVDYTYQGTGKITLGANLIKLDTDNLNILTVNDYSGFTAIMGGTVNVGNGSTSGSLGTGPVSNNTALVFNIPDVQAIAGPMSGAGSLTLSGPGQVNLTGDNSAYSGSIMVNSGTLQVGASIAGGGSSGTLGTGPITDNTLLVFNRTGGTVSYGGSISGSGIVSNSGLGTVILSGNNTYSGNTVIAAGTIKVGSATAIPSGTGSGNVELDQAATGPSGTLDLNGLDTAINGLQGSIGTGTSTATVANNSGSATHTLIIGTGGNSTTYSGQIVDNTGSGGKVALLVEGGVTQTIDIESVVGNTYSGGTIISNVTILLTSAYANGVNPYANANSVALGSGPVTFYGGTLELVGSPQSSGSTTPTWTPGMGNVVIVPAGQTGTVSGCTRGPFNPATLQGGGTFVYIANYVRSSIGGNWSGFTGQVYWEAPASGDELGINANGGFNKVFCTNGLIVYSLVAGNPTISFGELSDDGTTTLEAGTAQASAQVATYSVGSADTSTNFGGSIADGVSIVKVGTGSWTLYSPTLTYSGSTAVSNGILAFTAAIPSSTTPWTIAAPGILDVSALGALTVGTAGGDQTIQGNGTIRGSLTAGADATVEPGGASIGTLTVTNAVSLNGSIIMKLNTTNGVQTNDMLSAASIVLGGTLSVTNTGPTLYTGASFQLFSSTNLSGVFTNGVTLPANDGNGVNYTWNTNSLGTTGVLTLLSGASPVSPVPTNSTNVFFSYAGGVLTLSWPSNYIGWQLQSQTNPPSVGITTNWVTISGSEATNTASFNISTSNTVFYRMIYQ
jgi:fibronectin-binding autotransporter adhesin